MTGTVPGDGDAAMEGKWVISALLESVYPSRLPQHSFKDSEFKCHWGLGICIFKKHPKAFDASGHGTKLWETLKTNPLLHMQDLNFCFSLLNTNHCISWIYEQSQNVEHQGTQGQSWVHGGEYQFICMKGLSTRKAGKSSQVLMTPALLSRKWAKTTEMGTFPNRLATVLFLIFPRRETWQ